MVVSSSQNYPREIGRTTMTIEQLRKLYYAKPFQPFVMHLADGREILVRHPEFIAAAPSGRVVTVFQTDNACDMIDLLLVTDLEIKATPIGP
jgi:hypothetical protein